MIVLLGFLLVQTPENARLFMRHIDPSLGKSIPEISYTTDCSDWQSKVFDPFMPTHLIGWLLVTLFLTLDWKITVLLFTVDELLELWWSSSYGNFEECWWDAILLDYFGCNLLGTLIGRWISIKLNMEQRDFFANIKSDPWVRVRGAIHMCFLRGIMLLNLFGFKNVTWIPSGHWINIFNMLTCLWAPSMATASFYNWMSGRGYFDQFWGGVMMLYLSLGSAYVWKMGYLGPIWHNSSPPLKVMTVGLVALFIITLPHVYFRKIEPRPQPQLQPQPTQFRKKKIA